MARWRQVWDEVAEKYIMVPLDESAQRRDGVAIHASFEPFVSPVDGSVIGSRKQLEEHNRRNNVVQTREFGTEHWDIKRKEREKFYSGQHSSREKWERKAEIHSAIQHYIDKQG